jgi:cyclase
MVEELGAGELFITSIDKDGTQDGFDIELCKNIQDIVNIPVVISGGAGGLEHIKEIIVKSHPSGVGLASVLHYGVLDIPDIKNYLQSECITIRPVC